MTFESVSRSFAALLRVWVAFLQGTRLKARLLTFTVQMKYDFSTVSTTEVQMKPKIESMMCTLSRLQIYSNRTPPMLRNEAVLLFSSSDFLQLSDIVFILRCSIQSPCQSFKYLSLSFKNILICYEKDIKLLLHVFFQTFNVFHYFWKGLKIAC